MIRRYLLCLALITFSGGASAADPGECGTPEAITAKLKVEDQHTLAVANRLTLDKKIVGMLFTVSSDRAVGYILQADKKMGDRAGKICVWGRLAKVRVFDARKPVQPEAMLKAPETDALRRCDDLEREGKLPRSSCNTLNNALRKGGEWEHGVLLQGFLTERGANGDYRTLASLATVTGRIGGKLTDFPDNPARSVGGALYYSSLPDGATVINAVLAETEYTAYGLQAISSH